VLALVTANYVGGRLLEKKLTPQCDNRTMGTYKSKAHDACFNKMKVVIRQSD
jgi:hypothetical protein